MSFPESPRFELPGASRPGEPALPFQGAGARLGRDVVLSIAGVMTSSLLAAIGGLLVARLLGPSGKGQHALVMFAGGTGGVVATLGLEYWVPYAIASRTVELPKVMGAIRRQLRYVTVGSVTVGMILALGFHGSLVAVGLAAFVLAMAFSMLGLAVLNGQRRLGRVLVAQVAGGLSYVGGVSLLYELGSHSIGAVVCVAAVSTAVLGGAAWAGQRWWESEASDHRTGIRFGIPPMVGELLTMAAYRLDFVMVLILLDTRAVGLYSVALAIAELLRIVPNGVAIVVLPNTSANEKGRHTALVLGLTNLVSMLGAVALSVAGWFVVGPLFGEAFVSAREAIPALAAAGIALGAWKVLVADLVGRSSAGVRTASAAAGLATMVAMDALLIPPFGLFGAGLASLIGYSASVLVAGRAWVRLGAGTWRDVVDPRVGVRALSRLRRSRAATPPQSQ